MVSILCRQSPDTCLGMTDIVIIDPLCINGPYSRISWLNTYGAIINHPQFTETAQEEQLMSNFRRTNIHAIDIGQLDWYEWSIDSLFVKTFYRQLVLVIGEHDTAIDAQSTKQFPLAEWCRVIYTPRSHGMSLLENFREWISVVG